MPGDLVRRLVAEFIGTFVLVYTIVCTITQAAPLAPLAIGASLMVSIYAGGHISGAHFNPAVTIAVWLRGRISATDVGPYIAAQLLAAAAAAWLGTYTVDATLTDPAAFEGFRQIGSAFTAELIFTFVLAYVVLNVATSKDHPNNSFYGLAIGFTVVVGAVAVGGISGGAFNPAVAVGVSLAGLSAWANIWVYLVACSLGGAAAALAFRALNPDDFDPGVEQYT